MLPVQLPHNLQATSHSNQGNISAKEWLSLQSTAVFVVILDILYGAFSDNDIVFNRLYFLIISLISACVCTNASVYMLLKWPFVYAHHVSIWFYREL